MGKKNLKNRRQFVKEASAAALSFMIVPRQCVAGSGQIAPSDKVNLAFIGVGGKGYSALQNLKSQNIVAQCDVDWESAAVGFGEHPEATKYKDFRKMFDEQANDIDAVIVSTPDHTHAIAGMTAMGLDKHVYIEKPLAHNITEVRALTELAASKPHLITQMGNQGASGEGIRRFQELANSGLIGQVTKVYVWTNRPIWPQGLPIPTEVQAVPDHLDWNLWLGPAPERGYNKAFHPFAWRGYWDYGTGALGDMGCHIIDSPFYTLELGYPTSAEASVSQVFSQNWRADYTPESCPPSSKVHMSFPARGEKPAVEMVWMDGGILPRRPDEMGTDEPMGDWNGGILMEGTNGKILSDTYGVNPRLLPLSRNEQENLPEPYLPRVTTSHEMDWIGGIVNGYQPSSHLGKAGPLTEAILMGNLAIRSYNHRVYEGEEFTLPGRTKLLWDGPNMKVTNLEFANQFVSREYRTGW